MRIIQHLVHKYVFWYPSGKCDTFTIGLLSGNRDRNGEANTNLPGTIASPAIQVAVDEINNSDPPYFPNGHKLR